jgi:type IV pilus assembly protein PilX
MLLVMTLIGITGMQTTILEEKMAGNMRDQSLAFQAAESALKVGEYDIGANLSGSSPFQASCANGLCNPAPAGTPVWEDTAKVNWTTSTNTIAYPPPNPPLTRNVGAIIANIGSVANPPEYIIERLEPRTLQTFGESAAIGGAGSYGIYTPRDYRVTARAVGGTATATAMLQSTYRK